MPRKSILLFAAACLIAAAALAVATVVIVTGRDGPAPTSAETGQPTVGGAFQLVDQNGRAVDESLLQGKWSAVFFGFTWCPDYCPTTLQTLDQAQQRLGDQADDLQIVFISVDPERDTPEALRDYLASDGFPEGVIGLTGEADRIEAAARAYRAFYERVPQGDTYTMNHSLTVYLMNPQGMFVQPLSAEQGPERLAELIRGAMAAG